MARSALAPPPPLVTAVLVVLELLAVFGSVVPLEASVTNAVLLSGPEAFCPTFTVTVMVALALAFRTPRLQTSGFGAPQVPWLGVALPNVTFGPRGSVSVTCARATLAGPLLVTVIWYVRVPGAVTGSGESVFRMLRSACGCALGQLNAARDWAITTSRLTVPATPTSTALLIVMWIAFTVTLR